MSRHKCKHIGNNGEYANAFIEKQIRITGNKGVLIDRREE